MIGCCVYAIVCCLLVLLATGYVFIAACLITIKYWKNENCSYFYVIDGNDLERVCSEFYN